MYKNNACDGQKATEIKTSTHGRPQAWAKGGTCPLHLWKCCKVFLRIIIAKRSVDENYLCIIVTYCRRLLGAPPQVPTLAPSLDPTGWTFVPRPLLCSPLVKILRARMLPQHVV